VKTEADNSFAFVQNLVHIKHELPLELAPGHFLRKASDGEIHRIKEFLQHSPLSLLMFA